MKWHITALIASLSISANADNLRPSEKEIGVIACIERGTKFDADNDSKEKAQLVNAIFQEMGLEAKYEHSRHADSWNKFKSTDDVAYLEGYSACDGYLSKVDPEGAKYANYD